jgi:hypothetical protein
LAVLGVSRNCNSQKQREDRSAGDSNSIHRGTSIMQPASQGAILSGILTPGYVVLHR